jgi:acid phosphatase family membrane protein YuiD
VNYIGIIFQNKYVTVPALTWFIAQMFKLVFTLFKYKEFDFMRLFGTGGMPSSHTGYVVALCTVIGKSAGVDSMVFGLSFAFAIIVMSDAAGVRQAAGKQAKLLNSLMSTHFPGEAFNEQLKELIGHKPLEVLIGAILGLIMGIIFG